MEFACWLSKKEIVSPCPVKTCMWSSTNECGCMANPEPPDLETLSDGAMAKHKGLTLPELVNKRVAAQRRIKNILILSEFLDWCQGRTQPWREGYGDTELAEVVDNLCRNHWPYNVDDLGWRVRHVAFTLHKPSVDLFQAHVGKTVEWFDIIELGREEIQGIVKIFKTASSNSRKTNGNESKSQV